MKKIIVFLIILINFCFITTVKASNSEMEKYDMDPFVCKYHISGVAEGVDFSMDFEIEVNVSETNLCELNKKLYVYRASTGKKTEVGLDKYELNDIQGFPNTKYGNPKKVHFDIRRNGELEKYIDRKLEVGNSKCPTLYWGRGTNQDTLFIYNNNTYGKEEIEGVYEAGSKLKVLENILDEKCSYTFDLKTGGKKQFVIYRKKELNGMVNFLYSFDGAEKKNICNVIAGGITEKTNFSTNLQKGFGTYSSFTIDETYTLLTSPRCIDGNKLYSYTEKGANSEMAYHVTMDKSKAEQIGIADTIEEGELKEKVDENGILWNIDTDPMTCEEILGPVLTKIIYSAITILQIVAAIIAIVRGMLILIPPIVSKDADALKKASKTLVILGIILMAAIAFRPIIRLFGSLLGYDISCIV